MGVRIRGAREESVKQSRRLSRDPRAEESLPPPVIPVVVTQPRVLNDTPPTWAAALEVPKVESAPESEPPGRVALVPEPSKVSPELMARLAPALALHARMGETYYQLLGVDAAGTVKDVRRAYFKLSKQCHPDVFFRQSIGPYRQKLEAVFDLLTRAYETLKSEGARQAYDAEHGIVVSRVVVTAGGSLPPEPAPPAPESTAEKPEAGSPEARRASRAPLETEGQRLERTLLQRERLLRGLRSNAGGGAPASGAAPPPVEDTKTRRDPQAGYAAHEALTRELARLKLDSNGPSDRPRESHVGHLSGGKKSTLLNLACVLADEATALTRWASLQLVQAHAEEAAGQFLDAANMLRTVLEKLDDKRVRAEADRLKRAAAHSAAANLRAQARAAERECDFRGAAARWKQVVSELPDDAEAHLQAARCLLEIKKPEEAIRHARRAAALLPTAVQPREALLRCFEAAGLPAEANRERLTLERMRASKPRVSKP